jgi:D-aminopeptidase
MVERNKAIGDTTSTVNIVVGECNDGYLNSLHFQTIKPEHAIEALENAKAEPVEQGAVGAGKGMVCFSYKGGIGTASRIVSTKTEKYTVGCLVLSNFGKREEALFADWSKTKLDTPDGSIMMVIATNAPLYSLQLKRLAKRCAAGLGRVGSNIDHGSGDIAIAFSTANTYDHQAEKTLESIKYIRNDHKIMNQLFQAVLETTEEAIINSMKYAEATYGRKGRYLEKAPL